MTFKDFDFMNLYSNYTIYFLWFIFSVYWILSAKINNKRNIFESNSKSWFFYLRLRYAILFLLFVEIFIKNKYFVFYLYNPQNFIIIKIGVILSIGGIICILWSRYFLGKEYNSLPAIKEGHALITKGPYKYVRHPIYSSMLFSLFGSALLYGNLWIIFFIYYAVIIHFKKKAEEKILIEKFKDQYLKYKKDTKSLIPFIF